jgi:hypothetical protein
MFTSLLESAKVRLFQFELDVTALVPESVCSEHDDENTVCFLT